MPILIAVDHLHWIVHIRRNTLDQRNLVLDRNGIGHHQRARIMRARAHSVDRPAPSFDPDEVVSEVVQLLLDSRLSRVPDCHDTDDRRNSDGNSQNRQDASHLVSEQRNQCGSKECSVVHSSNASSRAVTAERISVLDNKSVLVELSLRRAIRRRGTQAIYWCLPEGHVKAN